jgi:hypothetical protein
MGLQSFLQIAPNCLISRFVLRGGKCERKADPLFHRLGNRLFADFGLGPRLERIFDD